MILMAVYGPAYAESEILKDFTFNIIINAVGQLIFLGIFFLYCYTKNINYKKAAFITLPHLEAPLVPAAEPPPPFVEYQAQAEPPFPENKTEGGQTKAAPAKKFNKPAVLQLLVAALAAGICLFGFMYSNAAFEELLKLTGYTPRAFPLDFDTFPRFLAGILVACLLPAVCEELIFRGIILRGLRGLGKVPAVLLSAAAFSLVHMSPMQTVHQFLLGVVLAIVALETRSILAPMLIHFVNNLLALILVYARADEVFGNVSVWAGYLLAILTLIASAALIYLIIRLIRKIRGTPEGDTEQVPAPHQQEKSRALMFLGIGGLFALLMWFLAFASGFLPPT